MFHLTDVLTPGVSSLQTVRSVQCSLPLKSPSHFLPQKIYFRRERYSSRRRCRYSTITKDLTTTAKRTSNQLHATASSSFSARSSAYQPSNNPSPPHQAPTQTPNLVGTLRARQKYSVPARYKKIWDDERQPWVMRWGWKGKYMEEVTQWLHEVPANSSTCVPNGRF